VFSSVQFSAFSSNIQVTKKEDTEEAKVQALASVAGEGDQVWVKVISVKVEEDGSTKVACSMKYVNQGNGQDLDPNNVQLEQKISRPPWQEPQKVTTVFTSSTVMIPVALQSGCLAI